MGDMADYLTERGEGEWFMHLEGDCSLGCPYCKQEAAKMGAAAPEGACPSGEASRDA